MLIAATERNGRKLLVLGLSAGERARDAGLSDAEVIQATMRAARHGFMAPTEDQAFLASLCALIGVWPDREEMIHAEARAIGDRNKVLQAVLAGVLVDLGSWEPADFPDPSLDLMAHWRAAAGEPRE